MVLRKQNEILRRNYYSFKIVAAIIAGFLQIAVGQHQANAGENKPTKPTNKPHIKTKFLSAIWVLCWLSAGDEFHAQWENIKMSGCKTPCKVLAKFEYENRYQKNSKPARLGGNIRSLFEREGQQFLQLRESVVRTEILFLIHSHSCG